MDKLKGFHKFLETYNLLRLNHKEIESPNRPIMCKETESVIKSLPTQKSPRPYDFTGEFYKSLKKN